MIEIQLPDFLEIIETGQGLLLEKTVRHNGIWRFHKCDPDDIFPSDPHGDRVDEPEKLNIYNGFVYSMPNKTHIRTLPKKAMIYICKQLLTSKEDELKNKIKENKSLITYMTIDEDE